ncbi:MAG: Mrr restriction system protein [Flavobacteriales bacterium]|nr:Mrr restriction system protein [Flavobacteriales bacterium]
MLTVLADGSERSLKDTGEALSQIMGLSKDDLAEILPSGGQSRFRNRVAWASIYLRRAGLLTSPRRGVLAITTRGLEVLNEDLERIDVAYLKRYPEFLEFRSTKRESSATQGSNEDNTGRTPEELIDTGFEQLHEALGQELLAKVHGLSWMDFEHLVVQLLVRMGYGGSVKDAGRALAKGNDEGIDGTIKEDKLGLDVIYIQAKKWQTGNTVGRPEIQKFVGALAGQGAKKGIFITTSTFSKEAREYQPRNETKIALIDGEELTQLMMDHDLGVTTQRTYAVKRIDSDFFGEE